MSFHPNDIVRRGRAASVIVCGVLVFLLSAFFRAQVVRNRSTRCVGKKSSSRDAHSGASRPDLRSQGASDRGKFVGYTVSMLPVNEDSLIATLTRLRGTIQLREKQFHDVVRRYRRSETGPRVILEDASFDVISVLEEHRVSFPG